MEEGGRQPSEFGRGVTGAGNRLKWVAGVVLAVALAIAAVIALWPKPDPRDNASLTSVELESGVPLSEYKQRVASEHAQVGASTARGLASARTAVVLLGRVLNAQTETTETGPTDTGTTETGTTETGTTETGTTETGTTETGTTETGTTGTAPTKPVTPRPRNRLSEKAPVVLPKGVDGAGFSKRFNEQVLPRLEATTEHGGLPPVINIKVSCKELVDCPLADEAAAAMQNENGGAVSPETAATRIEGLLRQTRTIELKSATGGVPAGQRDYLGVLVSAKVRLQGMRHRDVVLRWSIWDAGDEHRLFGAWLASNVAYGLKADTEDDTVDLPLWIPMPKQKGPFYVRVTLHDEAGTRLDQARTRRFK